MRCTTTLRGQEHRTQLSELEAVGACEKIMQCGVGVNGRGSFCMPELLVDGCRELSGTFVDLFPPFLMAKSS